MLLQIRDYIVRERRVSLQQLAREFHIAEQALLPMLDVWVRKGVIRSIDERISCQSSCSQCPSVGSQFYGIDNDPLRNFR